MKLTLQQPAKALSKAYLKQSLKREQMEQFKANLVRLFDSKCADLVIHNGRIQSISSKGNYFDRLFCH